MKILFVDGEDAFRNGMVLGLEKKFGHKFIGVSSLNEAMAYIKVNTDAKMVIADFVLPDGTADALYRHIKDNNVKVPFVWLTTKTMEGIKGAEGLATFEQDNPQNKYLNKHSDIDDLDQTIAGILGVTLKEEAATRTQTQSDKYCLIHTYRMGDLLEIKQNYYIKEGEGFKQVVTKESQTYSDIMSNLLFEKELEMFYLRETDYRDLVKAYLPLLSQQLKRRDHTPEDLIYFQRLALGLVYDIYYNLGASPEIMTLIPDIVAGVQVVASKTRNILGIVDLICENLDFTLELALCQSYIASTIGFDMNGDITSNVSKLVTASLLQDVMLAYNPKLTKVEDLSSDNFKSLGDAEKNLVKKHPELTIPILEKIGGVANSQDVFNLIRHHHEKPNGLGYPKELTSKNTPPLSCALILSKEISYRILIMGDQITKAFMEDMFTDLKAKFYKDNYVEPFDVIPFK